MNLAANTVQAASNVRADVKEQVTEGVTTLGQFNDFLLNYAPDIIAAIIIFIIGRYIAGFIKKVAIRMMTHANYDHTVITFVSQIIYYASWPSSSCRPSINWGFRPTPSWPPLVLSVWLSAWPCRATCRTLPRAC